MNVLSLFDGMSCGQIALERAGIKVDKYYASEIDKYAMAVTQHNYPDTIQLGCVKDVKAEQLPKIDILIGGSPCQGFSFAGKQLNFDDPRSALFFEFVRLLKECKPKYFMLENVRMKKEYQDVISEQLGVEPIMINSALVSAQNRVRLYWTNIPNITQPEDKGILLKDIVDGEFILKTNKQFKLKNNQKKVACLTGGAHSGGNHSDMDMIVVKRCVHIGNAIGFNYESDQRVYSINGKAPSIRTSKIPKIAIVQKPRGNNKGGLRALNGKLPSITSSSYEHNNHLAIDGLFWCRLTTTEIERAFTITVNYTLIPWQKRMLSNTQRYKMLGNGWTVDVIVHIFGGIQ